jgi:flagellar motor switch protein FliG
VDRIGRALVAQIEDAPEQAFASPPVARVGAILNSSKSGTRDDVLLGLDESDMDFATKVRKEIFTFRHIALRMDGREIGIVLRSVDNDTLIIAMSAAQDIDDAHKKSVEFILKNSSTRMADQMREAIAETGPVKEDDAERCISEIVLAIRDLVDAGEILLTENTEEDAEAAAE